MGRPINTIKVEENKNNTFKVWYIRKSDSKLFEYKIKFEGFNIIWGSLDGRWRETPDDEKLKFLEVGNTLKITQTYSDGSENTKEFKK